MQILFDDLKFELRVTLSDKISLDKIEKISAWCQKFCQTKKFVREKLCPIFQYKVRQKLDKSVEI